MRHTEGPTTESEILVDAGPERLWPLVTDLERLAVLSDELQRVEMLDGADGAGRRVRFRGFNIHPRVGSWSTVSTVTTWDPPRRFGWTVEPDQPGGPAATWLFELTSGDDGTRVRQWVRLGPGPSGLTAAIERHPDREEQIVARRLDELRAAMERNLTAFKEIAEAG